MDNWLTYSPTSGHGNAQITLTATTLTELQDRVATLIASGTQGGQTLSATTVITQKHLTLIYFKNLTWVTDVAWSGGTADKNNCTYAIFAKYSDGSEEDITNKATISGSLVVSATTATARQSVGTLTLTATYEGKTCTGNVTAYQEAFSFSQEPLTFKISSPGTINWIATDSSVTKTIEYKLNDGEWTSITSNTGASAPSITVSTDDKIQFRGDNTAYGKSNYGKYTTFSGSTAEFEIEGNIMSLINSTDFATLTTLESGSTFVRLFSDCTGLTSAENLILPATSLAEGCYSSMFDGCTSLVTAPELPAADLVGSCYMQMFSDCTSLTNAPALPATTLANGCYSGMFQSCTSLTTAPELPANTLANSCYNGMFYSCTSLTTAPAILPATTLANNCYYNMFANCTSLVTAPALPADTLAGNCYQYMFANCTSLTQAPALPATKLASSCYDSMFYNCTKLTTVPELPATTLANSCYEEMFQNCTSLTTAPVLPATTLTQDCYFAMFQGCTSLTTAPELPATTLTQDCYLAMFSDCTSLVTAPALPATSLDRYCYDSMFRGCTSLTTAPVLPATSLDRYCYRGMFRGCTSLTIAPSILPATSLSQYCYDSMFRGCTSLTTAPELPATSLDIYCYDSMFRGCSSLNYIKCLATDINVINCTYDWVRDVASTGTFVKNPNMTNWAIGAANGIPGGWTVIDAT